MGWRAWTRERLTAALLQDYVQDQVVQHYLSRTQRTAEGPTVPTEGMVSWLEDEQVLEAFMGGAWTDPMALGVVLHSSQTAASPANDTLSFLRLSGGVNAGVKLYPGRLYEAVMQCGVLAGTASTQHEAVVKMNATGTTPAASDPTVSGWRGAIGGVGAAWGWYGDTSPIAFRVNASGDYTFSPWYRRTAGTGTTQLTVHPASGVVAVKVYDRGSLARRAQRQSTNEDTILTI